MFIEELWEKDSELVKKALKRICKVNEEAGEKLHIGEVKSGVLFGAKYGDQFYEIEVSDYEIKVALANRYSKSEALSKRWFKFMHSVMGDNYVSNYIAHRNAEVDKMVNRHKKETEQMLETINFDVTESRVR